MSINWEKVIRTKKRFQTPVGKVGAEDLWDLSLQDLNTTAKNLNAVLKQASEEDFLQQKDSKSEEMQEKFDIVLYVLRTKQDEQEKRKHLAEANKQNALIRDLIQRKKESELESLSVEELEKRLLPTA